MQPQAAINHSSTGSKIETKSVIGRLATMCVLIAVFILAGPNTALAHARLACSTPKPDTELAQAPATVELWFNELLDEGFNSISVFAVAEADSKLRKNLTENEARVDAKDRTHLSVVLQVLPPGDYVVEWGVLSLDGHTARGKFKFKIRAGG
jgi:methionine-rich copper-binding protein CopC